MKQLKKITALLLALCMLFAVPVAASAETERVPTAPANSANIKIDGEYLRFVDAIPENVSGRIMIPYRVIFEYLGATVDYDGETGIISGEKDGMRLEMKNGVKTIDYTAPDGTKSEIQMDVAPYIKNGRTFVPVRFISSTLGYSVGWDNDMRTVIVIDKDKLFENLEKDFSLMLSTASLSSDPSKTFEVNGDMSMCIHMDTPEGGTTGVDIDMKTAGLMKGMRSVFDIDMNMSADGETINTTGKMRSDTEKDIIEMQLEGITPEGQWEDVFLSDTGIAGMDSIMGMAVSGASDMTELLVESLSVSEDEYTVDTYEQMEEAYNMAKSVYGDKAFVKNGNTYTASFDVKDFIPVEDFTDVSDMGFAGKIIIRKDYSGKVTGADTEMKMYSDDPSAMFEMVFAQKSTANSNKLSLSVIMAGLDMRVESAVSAKLTNKTFVW